MFVYGAGIVERYLTNTEMNIEDVYNSMQKAIDR